MRLIGMLDSPYVRRVAISLNAMGIGFTHEPLSVFGDYASFEAINPVVKAPTLVLDDGTVLSDSTLILEWAERIVPAEHRLTPARNSAFLASQRVIGLALAACEKSVQIVYETRLRPENKQHAPWLDRVTKQLHHAYAALEAEFAGRVDRDPGARLMQAEITTAVAWRFTGAVLPATIDGLECPTLRRLSQDAEATPAFRSASFD